jgi:hypothetical protein
MFYAGRPILVPSLINVLTLQNFNFNDFSQHKRDNKNEEEERDTAEKFGHGVFNPILIFFKFASLIEVTF